MKLISFLLKGKPDCYFNQKEVHGKDISTTLNIYTDATFAPTMKSLDK